MFAEHCHIDHRPVDVPQFDGAKQTFNAVDNLESAAVTERQNECKTGIAGSLLDTFVKLLLGAPGQISQPTNGLKTHILLEQFRRFLLQKFFQQMHQRDNFSSGALPVFSGERVKREIFHLYLATTFHTFSNSLGARFVAFNSLQSARLRPTAVAIHDYGNVARNSLNARRHYNPLSSESVAGRQGSPVAK